MIWLVLVLIIIWIMPSALIIMLYLSSLACPRARGWLLRNLVS